MYAQKTKEEKEKVLKVISIWVAKRFFERKVLESFINEFLKPNNYQYTPLPDNIVPQQNESQHLTVKQSDQLQQLQQQLQQLQQLQQQQQQQFPFVQVNSVTGIQPPLQTLPLVPNMIGFQPSAIPMQLPFVSFLKNYLFAHNDYAYCLFIHFQDLYINYISPSISFN